MKIAFDIGGVLSKFPNEFRSLIDTLMASHQIHVITDMHDHTEVVNVLIRNGFKIPSENVHCADYTGKGEYCKAILLKELGIDIFIDDFGPYLTWDSALGPAPIRLMIAPDGFRPYWHPEWQTNDNCDFGRRVTSLEALST